MNCRTPRPRGRVLGLFCVVGLAAAAAAAEPPAPLHDRIDQLVEASRVGPAAAIAGDAEFLRRLSLDLIGMPPGPDELRAFLADKGADKRPRAVDRLLADPLHARHMATALDVMLMERRPSQFVPDADWYQYLLTACRQNRPINELFREILAADGLDPKLRPAVRFYLDRGSEPNLITRDVGRVFLGRDLQCAQCHNHPLIDDYQQSDYHGLLAFFTPSYPLTRKEAGKDVTYYAEKSGVVLAFDSVFVKNDKHLTGARIQGGVELDEPVFPPGEEYRVPPADGVPSVPKHSRRAQLAALATGGGNTAFNENVANRLWSLMMGRGLVHPLDLHHPANPPSHPELLRLLGSELVRPRFDTKAFLREVALSRTYQRMIDLPDDDGKHPGAAARALAELQSRTESLTQTAEVAQDAYKNTIKAWYAAESALVPAVTAEDQAVAKHAQAAKKAAEVQKALELHLAQIKAREDVARALAAAAEKVQEAVKKLPAEKDLAAAADKFVGRSKAVAAEVTALQKATAAKAESVKKAADQLPPLVEAVRAARAKALPLHAAVLREEQTVVAARGKMAQARVTVEVHKRRIETVEAWVLRESLDARIAAADREIAAARGALGQLETRALAQAEALAKLRDDVKAKDQARLAAKTACDQAQADLDRRERIVASVVAAHEATDAARRLAPEDQALTTIAARLKARADELRLAAAGPKTQQGAAAAELKKHEENVAAAGRALAAAAAEQSRQAKALDAAKTAVSAGETRSRALQSERASAVAELATLLANDFQLGQLKPLTPEQLYWSILKTTGVYDRARAAEDADLSKTKPLAGAAMKDPAVLLARSIEIEQRTFDKLKGSLASFVHVYAAAAGQPQGDFFATPDQALFASNGGLLNSWIAPAAGNVSDRMIREPDSAKAALDLYLTVLSRPPSSDEAAEVARALKGADKARPAVVQELVWGLLTSAEFRFNH